jgi:hypothetical protein
MKKDEIFALKMEAVSPMKREVVLIFDQYNIENIEQK